MVIGIKDGAKLFAIAAVCCCAVFVCTFFLNFYLDALELETAVQADAKKLYDVQLATAKLSCGISGGVLCLLAVVMLMFYIKLFIDTNSARLGLLKAMGYRNGEIARKFWVFGLSVFIGTAIGYCAGYAFMPTVYAGLQMDGVPTIHIGFHVELLLGLVVLPSVAFGALACLAAYFALDRNVLYMLKGEREIKPRKQRARKHMPSRGFIFDAAAGTLSDKKATVFFVAVACFCFAAMMQMGMSMYDLSSEIMGAVMFAIGLVLAVTMLIMAVTAVINGNIGNIALMKAYGYTAVERTASLLVLYIPFALVGFAVGTVYQYVLLRIVVDVVFDGVAGMPPYSFDVAGFFITLASFVVAYSGAMAFYSYIISKVSVKAAMSRE